VAEYNRTNRDTEFIIKEYAKISDNPIEQFNLDISSGKGADIIDLKSFGHCINRGIVEDLSDYINESEMISSDDLIESVLEVSSSEEKILFVVPSFNISTLVVEGDDYNDGWTPDQLKAFIESKDEEAIPFACRDKSTMLEYFMGGGVNSFVNYENKECYFKDDEFKYLLFLCNEKGDDGETDILDEINSEASLLHDGKALFYSGECSFNNVQVLDSIFEDDFTYVGYPTKDKNGSYFTFSMCLGLNSMSDKKKDAWKLLEMLLSEEYQYRNIDYDGELIPTRKDCLKELEKSMCATESYTNNNGLTINPIDDIWKWGDVEIKITPLNQSEIDKVEKLIDSTKKISGQDWVLMDIVMEESKSYFKGEKDLEETINIIQNRAELYINENY